MRDKNECRICRQTCGYSGEFCKLIEKITGFGSSILVSTPASQPTHADITKDRTTLYLPWPLLIFVILHVEVYFIKLKI